MSGGDRGRLAWRANAAVGVWNLVAVGCGLVGDQRLRDIGRADLVASATAGLVLVTAIVIAFVVGTAVVRQRPGHPVGWIFLALSALMALVGPLDAYVLNGAVARPGSLPGANALAGLSDIAFLPWLALVALVLHLTPTGHPLSPRWARVAQVTAGAGAVGFVGGIFRRGPFDPPLDQTINPIGVAFVGPVVMVAVLMVGLGLIAAGISMVLRFRRAEGLERRQLQWMYLAAVPLPLFVPAAFLGAYTDQSTPLMLATAGFIVLIPAAAGLAITQYHLYEVDRILSRTLTYALLTAVIAVTYVSVVTMAGRALARVDESSTLAAVVATLAAVSVFSPGRRAIQNALDRRFNRRRFEAVRVVQRRLAVPASSRPIEEVLREALGDRSVSVSYWVEERGQWVLGDGRASEPPAAAVEVRRGEVPVARIDVDGTRTDRELLEAVAATATPELDNARLRAAISLQLVEVNESRARIAAAQLAERHRIERNLHDGAQQRLLAMAFQLQAAQVNGDVRRLREAVAEGVEQAQAAVLELRDLANGLHPAVLSDGGLQAALEDLVERTPVPIDVRATEARFTPEVEATAWFIVCEAVTNAQKHGGASHVVVAMEEDGGWLTVSVSDDGRGGADPSGQGLRGVRDRAEAAGGTLEVLSSPESGTTVRGRLPCGR
ncbi:MAG TPA: histidine kinase [Egibacteraceae bacterium]|nr:histidine kinase [Egibacteraceae bacterium]